MQLYILLSAMFLSVSCRTFWNYRNKIYYTLYLGCIIYQHILYRYFITTIHFRLCLEWSFYMCTCSLLYCSVYAGKVYPKWLYYVTVSTTSCTNTTPACGSNETFRRHILDTIPDTSVPCSKSVLTCIFTEKKIRHKDFSVVKVGKIVFTLGHL